MIRLAGQGEPGANGAPAGDLFLHVQIQPHRVFALVEESDLQIELPVTPWEAALGANISVPTLDGRVQMPIPAGAQAAQRLRLRGRGLNRRGGGRGDEYVKLKIVNPPTLGPKEKKLFEQLAAESRFNARRVNAGRVRMAIQIVLRGHQSQRLISRRSPPASRCIPRWSSILFTSA